MANDSFSQQALANDGRFRQRVKNALSTVAWQVLNESTGITGHVARAAYARNVIGSLDAAVQSVSGWIVTRTNLMGANTTVSLIQGVPVVTTDATDASIESQIATDWTLLSGA